MIVRFTRVIRYFILFSDHLLIICVRRNCSISFRCFENGANNDTSVRRDNRYLNSIMYAKKFNSALERLRNEASRPPNLGAVVLDINQSASIIHASCLFENEGKPLLQKLCLLLSATASGKSYGDWQKFAAVLGLMTEQIRCIDYDFKGLQDPTYYVLLTYSQSAESYMNKIFLALQTIDRLDIINRIADSFNDFVKDISQNKNFTEGTYKSKSLPRAPLVLSPVLNNHHRENQNNEIAPFSSAKPNVTNVNKKYGSIVMLTFAEDGKKNAEEIAAIFRSKEPKIGVIILQEQEKHVYCRAEEFIEDCFKQVNYIVPILTEEYLYRINNYNCVESDNKSLDSKYLRYIFSLLRYEYVKQDCVNNRVRCIIPDSKVNQVLALDLHPTLQAWFRESGVQLFAERILLQNF